ncbi:MAG: hypothetical protein WAU88_00805 [Candidatus Zixiibacteriota bacterium]
MSKHYFRLVAGMLITILVVAEPRATELRISVGHVPSPICFATRDTISVTAFDLTAPVRSFRLALALAENSQTFLDVLPGTFMTNCNWEYLGWKIDRTTPIENSPAYGPAETAILEINGAASTTTGHMATCFQDAGEQELVKLVVAHATSTHGTNDPCSFVPFRFYWRNCRDNSLEAMSGDTVIVASGVSEPNENTISNPSGFLFPGYGAPGPDCNSSGSIAYLPTMVARNGGFDLVCTDSLSHCRGDLNCNGIPGEVSDVVVFVNYFQLGIPGFNPHPACSIAESDVNGDGIALTVADLVYLIRVITGDVGF